MVSLADFTTMHIGGEPESFLAPATVSFSAQSVTNTGAEARHLGMYFGWSWVRPLASGGVRRGSSPGVGWAAI